MIRRMNKKGQIAIFVILAFILIVVIAIIFLLRSPPEIETVDENNPQAYIESCTRKVVEEAIDILSVHGGDIEPKGNMMYNGTDIVYLCYNSNFYEKCINQRPLLVEHIEKEITDFIRPTLVGCFRTLKLNLDRRYDVDMDEEMEIRTKLQSKHVSVEIDRHLEMTRGDQKSEFDFFKMNLIHPIYDLAKISMEIVNQETEFCKFDELGYMVLHQEYDVIKAITGDDDTVYTVEERASGQKFTFAVRGCVMPPGYGI